MRADGHRRAVVAERHVLVVDDRLAEGDQVVRLRRFALTANSADATHVLRASMSTRSPRSTVSVDFTVAVAAIARREVGRDRRQRIGRRRRRRGQDAPAAARRATWSTSAGSRWRAAGLRCRSVARPWRRAALAPRRRDSRRRALPGADERRVRRRRRRERRGHRVAPGRGGHDGDERQRHRPSTVPGGASSAPTSTQPKPTEPPVVGLGASDQRVRRRQQVHELQRRRRRVHLRQRARRRRQRRRRRQLAHVLSS